MIKIYSPISEYSEVGGERLCPKWRKVHLKNKSVFGESDEKGILAERTI